jgi:hypothetical protein
MTHPPLTSLLWPLAVLIVPLAIAGLIYLVILLSRVPFLVRFGGPINAFFDNVFKAINGALTWVVGGLTLVFLVYLCVMGHWLIAIVCFVVLWALA